MKYLESSILALLSALFIASTAQMYTTRSILSVGLVEDVSFWRIIRHDSGKQQKFIFHNEILLRSGNAHARNLFGTDWDDSNVTEGFVSEVKYYEF